MLIKVVTLVNKYLESATHLNKQYLEKEGALYGVEGILLCEG